MASGYSLLATCSWWLATGSLQLASGLWFLKPGLNYSQSNHIIQQQLFIDICDFVNDRFSTHLHPKSQTVKDNFFKKAQRYFASLKEFVGYNWFRECSKIVIQGQFQRFEAFEAVRFSGSHFRLGI